jgi:hypothetical protein
MITCSKNQISLGTAPVGLENNRLQTALRRGGSSPEVSVANMYTNSGYSERQEVPYDHLRKPAVEVLYVGDSL